MTDEERKVIDARNIVLEEVARVCDRAAREAKETHDQFKSHEIVERAASLGAAEQASKLARRFRLMQKCYV